MIMTLLQNKDKNMLFLLNIYLPLYILNQFKDFILWMFLFFLLKVFYLVKKYHTIYYNHNFLIGTQFIF